MNASVCSQEESWNELAVVTKFARLRASTSSYQWSESSYSDRARTTPDAYVLLINTPCTDNNMFLIKSDSPDNNTFYCVDMLKQNILAFL